MRILYEDCPMCYGEGCHDCDHTAIIAHGPWHDCQFCDKEACGCGVCQSYSPCKGYWEHYIRPYQEEQQREGVA